jgi:hypothetical protein
MLLLRLTWPSPTLCLTRRRARRSGTSLRQRPSRSNVKGTVSSAPSPHFPYHVATNDRCRAGGDDGLRAAHAGGPIDGSASSPTPATEELAKKDFPSFDLTGKKALVTGATKGLGRHAATALAHAGVDVFLSGRDEGELAECAEEVRAQGRRAETQATDLTDVNAVVRLGEAAIEAMGRVDVLLNDAGVALLEPLLDVTVKRWDAQLNVNLRAPFFLAQTVARGMIESGRVARSST